MNKSEAAAYLPFIQALVDGQSVEFSPSEGRNNDWINRNEFDFTASPSCYRIKPEPVMIPLGPEDVPPWSVLRHNSWGENSAWRAVTAVTRMGVHAGAAETELYSWGALAAHFKIKRPGKDWMPCCKPAQ